MNKGVNKFQNKIFCFYKGSSDVKIERKVAIAIVRGYKT